MNASATNRETAEIMSYVENELRADDALRAELAAAVRRKDTNAVRKVAATLWKDIQRIAPIALANICAILGIPSP